MRAGEEQETVVCRVEAREPGSPCHAIRLAWPGEPPTAGIEKVGIGDLDGDGRDEVALGSLVLDDTGVPLWSTGRGHPDGLFIGDIDPRHPGLEMFTHIETRRQTGGMLLVDAATGRTLWELDTPTVHVHGGMCDDVDPDHPGLECYAADKKPVDGKDRIIGKWFRTASGRPLTPPTDWDYRRPTVYWDADPQKELIFDRSIRKFRDATRWTVPNHVFVPIDLVGDWREELLVFTGDELRLHLSTVPAQGRGVCLMQDRIYRSDIAMCAMAYHRHGTPGLSSLQTFRRGAQIGSGGPARADGPADLPAEGPQEGWLIMPRMTPMITISAPPPTPPEPTWARMVPGSSAPPVAAPPMPRIWPPSPPPRMSEMELPSVPRLIFLASAPTTLPPVRYRAAKSIGVACGAAEISRPTRSGATRAAGRRWDGAGGDPRRAYAPPPLPLLQRRHRLASRQKPPGPASGPQSHRGTTGRIRCEGPALSWKIVCSAATHSTSVM